MRRRASTVRRIGVASNHLSAVVALREKLALPNLDAEAEAST
jgi:hypothetical protein